MQVTLEFAVKPTWSGDTTLKDMNDQASASAVAMLRTFCQNNQAEIISEPRVTCVITDDGLLAMLMVNNTKPDASSGRDIATDVRACADEIATLLRRAGPQSRDKLLLCIPGYTEATIEQAIRKAVIDGEIALSETDNLYRRVFDKGETP